MYVSVDVAGKLVVIDAVFKNSIGSVVDTPDGATYEWSVTAGNEFVTVEELADDWKMISKTSHRSITGINFNILKYERSDNYVSTNTC